MGGLGKHQCKNVQKYLGSKNPEYQWTIVAPSSNLPKQNNVVDCGVFTIMYATYLTDPYVSSSQLGIPLDFNHRNMPYFRKRIALDILAQEIL